MAPRVSVIVATRNRTRLLEQAVASITQQEFKDFELLLVDDGSSEEVLQHHHSLLESLGPNFKLLRPSAPNCRGSGPSGARNRGATAALGDFLAFLDDDDEWIDTHYLSNAVRSLTEMNADLFFGDIDGLRDNRLVTPPWAVLANEVLVSSSEFGEIQRISDKALFSIARSRIIHPGQMVVRRSVFQECGGFFEGLWSNCEDRNLMLRIFDHSQAVLFYNCKVLRYRLPTGDSISCSEPELFHMLQRIMSAHHVRLSCKNNFIRIAARAGEAWTLREASSYQANRGHFSESLRYAMQGVITYPSLGSIFFLLKAITRSVFKQARTN